MNRIHLIIAFILAGFAAAVNSVEKQAEKSAPWQVDIAAFQSKYNIKIAWENEYPIITPHGKYTGKNPSIAQVEWFSVILIEELGRYTVNTIKKTSLKKIILSDDLAFKNKPVPSYADCRQDNCAILFDIKSNSYNEEHQRRLIHHELFHIIDWLDDGKMNKDDDWKRLNPKGFAYGMVEQDKHNPAAVNIKGFLNYYSTTALGEDKAEIFANLVEAYSETIWRGRNDEIINAKILMMKNICRQFSKDLGERFWEDQEWCLPVDGLQCRIADSKDGYSSGEAISFKLAVRNTSGKDINLPLNNGSEDGLLQIDLLIKYLNGKETTVACGIDRAKTTEAGAVFQRLQPEEIYCFELKAINELYPFKVGIHQININFQVGRQDENEPMRVDLLKTQPVFFEITTGLD